MYEPAKLSQRQKRLKLSNKEIAKRSGTNQYTVANFIETGRGTTNTAEAILKALEIRVEEEPHYRHKKTA